MTAPFFLVPLDDLRTHVGDVVSITGPDGRHAATVKRLAVGEDVLVGDGAGHVVEGTVAEVVGRDRVDVRVTAYAEVPAPSPRLVVVQALAKGERSDLSVELLTEVGVDVVVPWSAARSVAQWRGEKAQRGAEKWAVTAREAAKQSRRPWVPEVRALASTAEVSALLRASVDAGGTAVVLHEAASLRMASLRIPASGDVVLVVGPEGGIADDERAALEAAGGLAARLGPTVLRTSTAGTVAAAVVLAACGRWD
ncbi:MAG: 16S rRNA (uracil(1498)-N(3))-methyltransferase [Candidatus Nanopelagicales bacterium]